MKPNFLNRFMKKLTRERLVPIIFRQNLLADLWNYTLRCVFLAEASEQQKDPGQPLCAEWLRS
jgi:hypothetical protein